MKIFLGVLLGLMAVDSSLCINKIWFPHYSKKHGKLLFSPQKVVKLPPEAAGSLLMSVQTCMPSTGVPVEALLKVYQGGYSEDKKFKEFIYCCYKTAGYVTPDGRMNVEKCAKVFRNEPQVVEGIRRCGGEVGSTPKETVFKFFKCFQDTVPVILSL